MLNGFEGFKFPARLMQTIKQVNKTLSLFWKETSRYLNENSRKPREANFSIFCAAGKK